ncbi:CDP-glucose 4,6-dehydratase [Hyphomicrobium sp.]|uniref:CDP-glucose 4,6-dehydratase n=1 Tax=Hyphomicrobium sp. TaxID=82 RepID=UPI003F70CBC2
MTAAAGLSRTFWSGRRVFVTGHTGFKGGWLMGLLHRLGADAQGYALAPPSGPCVFTAADVPRFGGSTFGDIRDGPRLQAAMAEAAPEIVLHLAAQALVRPARADPIETFSTNVVGTAQVLEAVRTSPSVTACVVVTSDKVYDNVEWPWAYRETDRLGGKEPYGASKACTELVVESYRSSYFSGDGHNGLLASARAGNVIGGGDWAEDRLIPDAVRAFSAGQPLTIRNPSSVRPWQHVLEPLSGYLRLAEALATGVSLAPPFAYNFGPVADDAVPVRVIVDEITARWADGASWGHDARFQPYEARLLEVDSAKARTLLGWQPRWRLHQALDRTIDWYKAFYASHDMHDFTLRQIDEYLHG